MTKPKKRKEKDAEPWKLSLLGIITRDDTENARENGYNISISREWNATAKAFTTKYQWVVFDHVIQKRHSGVVDTRLTAMREARRFARTLPVPTNPHIRKFSKPRKPRSKK